MRDLRPFFLVDNGVNSEEQRAHASHGPGLLVFAMLKIIKIYDNGLLGGNAVKSSITAS
jgi:hypothetical protein